MSLSPQSIARTRDKRSHRVPARYKDDNFVIKKSSFHPSFRISNGAISGDSNESATSNTPDILEKPPPEKKASPTIDADMDVVDKPLPEKKVILSVDPTNLTDKPFSRKKIVPSPETTDNDTDRPISEKKVAPTSKDSPAAKILAESVVSAPVPPNSIPTSLSRKKSKGFSLIIKGNGSTGSQIYQNNSNVLNRSNLQPQQKLYNSFSQNMQYGARLMLNEPIYLPRSVATIAPITTTLQQIAAQARRPPFLSRKAEACIAYQEGRKFDHLTSNYTALVRVTKYLEVRDLLNLRLVNKSWRSIVDSDAVWKCVNIESSRVVSWPEFALSILNKYQTTALNLDDYSASGKTVESIVDSLSCLKLKLENLNIKTTSEDQNRFALELICGLKYARASIDCERSLNIRWLVKVIVEDDGRALVPIKNNNQEIENEGKIYCHEEFPDLFSATDGTALVELSDLEELLNGGLRDKSRSYPYISPPHALRVSIEPI